MYIRIYHISKCDKYMYIFICTPRWGSTVVEIIMRRGSKSRRSLVDLKDISIVKARVGCSVAEESQDLNDIC